MPKLKVTNTVIDLGSELLVDRTRIRSPHIQLLLAAIGQPLAKGSAWIAVRKEVAVLDNHSSKSFACVRPPWDSQASLLGVPT